MQARTRIDGWTAARQLAFLSELARTRSITKAACAAGMSRESAYRLRNRRPDGLFAALWDLALGACQERSEGHGQALTDGQLARLLGNQSRRESGAFFPTRAKAEDSTSANRARTL